MSLCPENSAITGTETEIFHTAVVWMPGKPRCNNSSGIHFEQTGLQPVDRQGGAWKGFGNRWK